MTSFMVADRVQVVISSQIVIGYIVHLEIHGDRGVIVEIQDHTDDGPFTYQVQRACSQIVHAIAGQAVGDPPERDRVEPGSDADPNRANWNELDGHYEGPPETKAVLFSDLADGERFEWVDIPTSVDGAETALAHNPKWLEGSVWVKAGCSHFKIKAGVMIRNLDRSGTACRVHRK